MGRSREYALKEPMYQTAPPKKKRVPCNCATCANEECKAKWLAVRWRKCRGWRCKY